MGIKNNLLGIYKVARSVGREYGLARFYPIKIVHKFILKEFVLKHLKTNFALVQGHKMFLGSKDSLNLSVNGIYEEYETELVTKEIKRGNIVLDIGANIGYYTLIFAKLVGESGKVFAFEPDPTNFAILKRNVEINGYENVVLIQKAVSNKSEKLRLYLSEDNEGAHRIYDSYDGRKYVDIESVRLDDYFNDFNGKIDFVKIDIEGAEWAAIQGMTDLLNRSENVKIFSEFLPIGLKRLGIEPVEYLTLLLDLNFSIYEINEKEETLDPVDITRLLETYTCEKEHYTNLMCCKI